MGYAMLKSRTHNLQISYLNLTLTLTATRTLTNARAGRVLLITQLDPIGPLRTILEHIRPHLTSCLDCSVSCIHVQALDITICKATN